MAAVTAFPDLSQLMAWPTAHLTDAAEHWEAVAERNYGLANRVWQDASTVEWHGKAADALRTATHSDMVATDAAADQLHSAAQVARSGASDLYAARSRLIYAIEDAHAAGFDVDEEGSVLDRSTGGSPAQQAARQAEAQTLAADIRGRAAHLVTLDQQVAGKVTAAVAGIRDVFPQRPGVQEVDNHTFKQEPAPRDPGADNPWKDLPSPRSADDIRNALRQLPRGHRKPNRQLDTPEEIKEFWDWLAKNAKDLPQRGDVTRKILDDGTEISVRPESKSGGPTIEAILPGGGKNPKVHLPLSPSISEPPQLPPLLDHPPSAPAMPDPGHPMPTAKPPTQFFDPADVPPWLKDPSPPGFTISPVQQPPPFGWDHPDMPAATQPAPPSASAGGQPMLPNLAHDLNEGGKAVFGWVVVGGVLIWTLLTGVEPSGAATP